VLCILLELRASIRLDLTNDWATIFVQIRRLQICFTFVLLLSFLSRVSRERIASTLSSTLLELSFFRRDVSCWVSSFLCLVDWFWWIRRRIRSLLSQFVNRMNSSNNISKLSLSLEISYLIASRNKNCLL
jgi:hypothetical protein